MSSDAKDTKACYTKAGVRAAPIKYGAFLLCNEDETPEIVKPTGAHDFCFSEVHRNVLHKETRNI